MAKLDWSVDPSADAPPSRQLVERVLDALASGHLTAGDRLPSVRGLAAEALVNHNTVARAYRDLEALGVTRGENGRGVFLTEEASAIARTARRDATLASFKRTAEEALRAGHPVEALIEHIVRTDERKTA